MRTLWFVVPVHGRLPLAAICLRQLRRTCDALIDAGVYATAVLVTEKDELRELRRLVGRDLGFGVVYRDNDFTSAKFNDGIELATSPRHNPQPADYVVPLGSDDWVDYRLFLEPLPGEHTIVGFQQMSFVREDGRQIASTYLKYRGGSGIRIIPRQLLEPFDYRPADPDRKKGCDTSILTNISREWGDTLDVQHWHLHERQIVDWKSPGVQINSYANVVGIHGSRFSDDPFGELAEFYPDEALGEMRRFYETATA
jgi:hypothetical protein